MAVVKTVAGRVIKEPSDFTIERYNITKAGRTAKGNMTMDFIAKKRKFLFRYTVLSGTAWDNILSAIDTNTMFYSIVYIENGIQKSATVYTGDISAERFRSNEFGWYWRDVTFNLIEK